MADEDDVRVRFGADTGAFTEGIKHIIENLDGLAKAAAEAFAFNEITEAVEKLIRPFERLYEAIHQVVEKGSQVEHMAAMIGASTEFVSSFAFAAGAMNVSMESAAFSMERLERNMAQAASGTGPALGAFEAMGLSVRNAAGQIKSLDEILPQVAEKFKAAADGPEKTAIAMALLGRSGAQMIPFLNQGVAGLEAFKKMAEDTGTVITGPMAAGFEKTEIAMFTMGESFRGIGITMFEAFKPAIDAAIGGMVDLAQSFNNALKSTSLLHDALTALVLIVDTIVLAFATMSAGLQQLWQLTATTVTSMIIAYNALGNVLNDVFTGKWGKIKGDVAAGLDAIQAEVIARAAKFGEAGRQWQETLKNLFSNMSKDGVDTSGGHGGHDDHKDRMNNPDLGGGAAQLDAWKQQLRERIESEVGFFADSKQLEAVFWQEKVNAAQGHSELLRKVNEELFNATKAMLLNDLEAYLASLNAKQAAVRYNYEASMGIENQRLAQLRATYGEDSRQYQEALAHKAEMERQHAEEVRRIKIDAANAQREISKIGLDIERDNLATQVALGVITETAKLSSEKEFTEKEYSMRRQALEDQKQLEMLTAEQRAKINNDILVLEKQHQADMAKLNNQTTMAALKDWKSLTDTIHSSFTSMIQGVLQGTQTMGQMMNRILGNLILSFIGARLKIELDWLAGQAAMALGAQTWATSSLLAWLASILGIKTAQLASDGTALTAASAKEGAITAIHEGAVATRQITDEAALLSTQFLTAEAATAAAMSWAAAYAVAAMASVAAIPFFGWAMAPEVGAEAYASGVTFAGLASLDVGAWEVPDDMTANIHKGEMVIPETFATGLRDGSFAGSGGGDGPAFSPSLHLQVNGKLSARDIHDLKGAVLDTFHQARRDFMTQTKKK